MIKMKKKSTTKSQAASAPPAPTFGEAVMVYTKSSSHYCALLQPKVVTIEGLKFIQGTQVTGKIGHRMEGKTTLIPFEHVASIIQFASEDALWSEPQAKLIRPVEDAEPSTILTSHENPGNGNGHPQRNRHHNNRHGGGHRNNRPMRGHDARLQHRYDSRRDQE